MKARVRTKNRLKSNRILLKICVIVMLFLGTSYSLLSQNLTLTGSVTIPAKEIVTLDGNATYTNGTLGGYIIITITNNNSFDVSSWTAEVYISTLLASSELNSTWRTAIQAGVNSATQLSASDCTIDVDNKKLTFSKTETISAGSGVKYLIGFSGSSPTLSVYAYQNDNIVTTDVQTAMIEANREQVTTYSSDLEGFVYTNENVDIVVSYEDAQRTDGKYETNVILNVSNYNDLKISNLSFDVLYNNTINEYSNITTNSLVQTASNESGSSYKTYDNSYISSNETVIYKISGLITDEEFEGIQIANMEYESVGELDTSNIQNTITTNTTSTITNTNIDTTRGIVNAIDSNNVLNTTSTLDIDTTSNLENNTNNTTENNETINSNSVENSTTEENVNSDIEEK